MATTLAFIGSIGAQELILIVAVLAILAAIIFGIVVMVSK